MERAGHHARPAVVLMRGFQLTVTFFARSGRWSSRAVSRHQDVMAVSEGSERAVGQVFPMGAGFFRSQEGR